MPETLTIDPDEPLDPGLDYALLKEEGIALVQQLSGSIWTDYNEHDPGVTTLEQLCYALTELSYRAEIPLADLLVDRTTGKINPRRQALFIARRIFPCNPVTENDYRKLLVDRVSGVANAWLTPYRARRPERRVDGLYDIWLYVPGLPDPVCHPEESKTVRDEAWRVYEHHRGLCEDAHAVRILRPVATQVSADVIIGDGDAPESILADLLFELGNFFAPELRRESLKTQLDRGETASEIFDGPLLLNGFITDDQLQPKASEIPVQDVVGVMAATPGVRAVSRVEVRAGGGTYSGQAQIPVARSEILELDTAPVDGRFTLRLFRNGIEVEPDARRVEIQLARRWKSYRRTYRLNAQYQELFAFPTGRRRRVRRYESIQNQYPNVYGISSYGLPEGSPAPRRGQAKQLKGYLLPFEQLLADFFAQLARAKDLYSIDGELRHTYFFQYLDRSVPDVEPLLKRGDGTGTVGYRRGLPQLVHSQDDFVARRNRFLDLLLALYAEQLDSSSVLELSCDGSADQGVGERLIAAKLALLRQLVVSTRDRGRGFDVMGPPTWRNVAGMEIKIRIQLGISGRPLSQALEEQAVAIEGRGAGGPFGRPVSLDPDEIEDRFETVRFETAAVETADEPAGEDGGGGGIGPAAFPHKGTSGELPEPLAVSEEVLAAARRSDSFRLGSLPGDARVAVVFRPSAEADWRLVGKFADRAGAEACIRGWVERMDGVYRNCQQLYVVEHNLLRFGRSDDGAGGGEHGPPAGAPCGRCDRCGCDPCRCDPCRCERCGCDPCRCDPCRCDPCRCDRCGCDPCCCHRRHPHCPGRFVYSFTVTAVVSACAELLCDRQYRDFVREVVRANAPVHVVVDYCFLPLRQLCRFEELYQAWRRALRRWSRRRLPRGEDWDRLVATSARLRRFLEGCGRPSPC